MQKWLSHYICDEAKVKKNETWNPEDWTVSAPRDIPAQLNGCDCGAFMVKYADTVVRGVLHCDLAPADLVPWQAQGMAFSGTSPFTQADMPYFRRRIVAECMQKKAV